MPVPASNVTSVESGDPCKTDAKHPSSSQDEFIYVPDNFKVKEGARLTEQLTVGKALGVGLQVTVPTHKSSVLEIPRVRSLRQLWSVGRRLPAARQ